MNLKIIRKLRENRKNSQLDLVLFLKLPRIKIYIRFAGNFHAYIFSE